MTVTVGKFIIAYKEFYQFKDEYVPAVGAMPPDHDFLHGLPVYSAESIEQGLAFT